MACLFLFLACPAEMLQTQWLKTGRLPILTGSDQVILIMYMTGLFPFKYGQFVLMGCQEVESWYLIKTGRQVFKNYKTEQDGSYNRQAIEIHIRMVTGGQSHSPDTESWWVGEISNMFNIFLIHQDMVRNYN